MINFLKKDNKFSWKLFFIIAFFIFILVIGSTIGIIFYLDKKKEEKEVKEKEVKEKEVKEKEVKEKEVNEKEENENENKVFNTNKENIDENQVFNTNKKLWTYKHAPFVCKKLGAELATYDQLLDAAKNGANWCNIGWFKEDIVKNEKGENILVHAGFPVQKDIYNTLQENVKGKYNINQCGPRLNPTFEKENYSLQNVGMYDTNYKFSVNCYGKKRSPNKNEFEKINDNNNINNDDFNLFNKQLEEIDNINPNIELLPFDKYKKQWDQYFKL